VTLWAQQLKISSQVLAVVEPHALWPLHEMVGSPLRLYAVAVKVFSPRTSSALCTEQLNELGAMSPSSFRLP